MRLPQSRRDAVYELLGPEPDILDQLSQTVREALAQNVLRSAQSVELKKDMVQSTREKNIKRLINFPPGRPFE